MTNDEVGKPFNDSLMHCFTSYFETAFEGEGSSDNWVFLKIDTKNRMVFVDYQHMLQNMPMQRINNRLMIDYVTDWVYSNDFENGMKLLAYAFNNWSLIKIRYEEVDRRPFEVRLANFKNHKRLGEINHTLKGFLISFRANILAKKREVLNFTTAKKWECSSCGSQFIQTLTGRQKEPKSYKEPCRVQIGETNGKPFRCGGKTYLDLGAVKVQPVQVLRVEAMQEESASLSDVPSIQLEITDNLTYEDYQNELIENHQYEFVGIVKFREIVKMETSFNLTIVDIQSFTELKKEEKIFITDEDRVKIKEFLARPDSLDIAADMLGTRVIGFHNEKKAALLMKLLQLKFNKSKDVKPRDFLMHMLLVGDYGRGKSELAEVIQDICENPVYLTASSTSGVGLSGATIRDETTGEFMIQAGAYAIASGEFLIIEEWDKKKNSDDMGILNEGLSKFKFTINKANKYRSFKAETVVIMVANPIKKNFDTSLSILPQINISGDLLSRFSFISVIIKPSDIETQLKINKMMVATMDKSIKEKDKLNAIELKKYLRIASDNNVEMRDSVVDEEVDKFTILAENLSKKSEGTDSDFWKQITPRTIKAMILTTKGVALWHGHEKPTKEDCKEAFTLYFSFLKCFLENPNLLNLMEISSGKTIQDIGLEIDEKIRTENWGTKKDTMQEKRKGKKEMLLNRVRDQEAFTPNGLANVVELQKWAEIEMQMSEIAFDEFYNKLKQEGDLFEPIAGFVKRV